jgi:hypothetical protein
MCLLSETLVEACRLVLPLDWLKLNPAARFTVAVSHTELDGND